MLSARGTTFSSFSLLLLATSGCSDEAPSAPVRTSPGGFGAPTPVSLMPVQPAPSEAPAPTTNAPSPMEAVTPMQLAPPAESPSDPEPSTPPVVTPGAEDDRCDVGVYDPAAPPRALELSGSLGAHDPVIIKAGERYHYFSTGGGISVKTSPDLLQWTQGEAVFPTTPAWFQELVPEYSGRSIWAPDIAFFGGQYHLYYSVSSFGDNRSCIGHATSADLEAGSWTDHEAVFCSNQPGQNQNFNAIDPNVAFDTDGTPWLSFGSFWSGIKAIRLDQNGDRAGTELIDLASRGGGAIEAPFIVRRCGYYYLFVSFDTCCQGANSTYNQRVGRSTELLGPYVDREGRELMDGGGTLLLQAGGDWVGPGHNAVLIDGTRAYNVYHAYTATNGASRLRISELAWDADGWPISGGP